MATRKHLIYSPQGLKDYFSQVAIVLPSTLQERSVLQGELFIPSHAFAERTKSMKPTWCIDFILNFALATWISFCFHICLRVSLKGLAERTYSVRNVSRFMTISDLRPIYVALYNHQLEKIDDTIRHRAHQITPKR